MRNVAFMAICMVLIVGGAFAEVPSTAPIGGSDAMKFEGVVSVFGIPRTTGPCYVDNTARTIQSLIERSGGTYLGGSDNTLAPISMMVSCDDKATR
jgi:hypothetical protein